MNKKFLLISALICAAAFIAGEIIIRIYTGKPSLYSFIGYTLIWSSVFTQLLIIPISMILISEDKKNER